MTYLKTIEIYDLVIICEKKFANFLKLIFERLKIVCPPNLNFVFTQYYFYILKAKKRLKLFIHTQEISKLMIY